MPKLPAEYHLIEELATDSGARLVRVRDGDGRCWRLAAFELAGRVDAGELSRWIRVRADADPHTRAGVEEDRVWVAVAEADLQQTMALGQATEDLVSRLYGWFTDSDDLRPRLDSSSPENFAATVIADSTMIAPSTGGSSSSPNESTKPSMDTAYGAELFAGFRIEGTLGQGGMGVVYRAWDPRLQRPVAIKMVLSQFLGTDGKDRFLSEARAASRINHPNVVTVYSAGEVDGNPYMAMELVEGEELRDIIDREPVEWHTALRWVSDLLDGLAPLHGQGILHRDIKPGNVLITADGVAKLVDFGLAKGTGAVDPGGMLGTIFYCPPEQARGEEVGPTADVYAMGAMLHEMLSGELPFTATDFHTLLRKICEEQAPALPDGEWPDELTLIVKRALEKDPAQRFQSAAEFRDELRRLLDESAAAVRAQRRRWIIGSSVAVACMAAVGVWIGSQFVEPEVDRAWVESFNELGVAEWNAGEVEEARAKYQAILLADSTYALAWNNLGMLELTQGLATVADSLFDRASMEDPDYAAPWFNRALLREDRGDLDGAQAMYLRAIQAEPGFGYAYNNLGFLLMDRGQLDAAAATLEKGRRAVAPEDGSLPYLLRTSGRVALAQGDLGRAKEWFEAARPGLPESTWAELDALIARTLPATDP